MNLSLRLADGAHIWLTFSQVQWQPIVLEANCTVNLSDKMQPIVLETNYTVKLPLSLRLADGAHIWLTFSQVQWQPIVLEANCTVTLPYVQFCAKLIKENVMQK
jgi:hypothetical protein